MSAPDKKKGEPDGSPKFGRLLIGLVLAVLLIVAITLGSQVWLGGLPLT